MSDFRVLEAITPSRIGGAEVYVANLCEKLPETGAQVELFCPKGRPFVDYMADRGVSSINWHTHGKFDPVTVCKLAALIKRTHSSVIHTHLSTASLLGAFAAKLAGVPSVAHVHGLNSATCFRYSTLIVAVSEAVKQHLCSQGISENKIQVVHNGVDLAKFGPVPKDEARRKFGLNPDIPIFGVFGRLSSEKGQRIALEAMFLLTREYPKAQLILAGDGKDREELQACAEALNITGNVAFAGFVPQPQTLMSACDAVIVPSLKEGFGLAAVEAMALERPVVGTNVGGLPEIIQPGETGFLTALSDPQAIAQALEELIKDKSLAERMGKRGRERAEECFNLDKQVRALAEVLKESGKLRAES